jgi:hypothetical protein
MQLVLMNSSQDEMPFGRAIQPARFNFKCINCITEQSFEDRIRLSGRKQPMSLFVAYLKNKTFLWVSAPIEVLRGDKVRTEKKHRSQ